MDTDEDGQGDPCNSDDDADVLEVDGDALLVSVTGTLRHAQVAGTLDVGAGTTLTQPATPLGAGTNHPALVVQAGSMTVAAGGALSATGKGYPGGLLHHDGAVRHPRPPPSLDRPPSDLAGVSAQDEIARAEPAWRFLTQG